MSKEYSELEAEIVNYLHLGRNEMISRGAKQHFLSALNLSKKNLKESSLTKAFYLKSLLELAQIETNLSKRENHWELLLKRIISFSNDEPENGELILHCSDLLISYKQESFIQENLYLQKKAFSMLKGQLDNLIKAQGLINSASYLLKKAAILRNFTSMQPSIEAQRSMAEQAFRCAEKGLSVEDLTWYGYLELANCYWHLSNFEKDLLAFNKRITQAENFCHKSKDIKLTAHNSLTLCNLFRKTYQSAPFIVAFTDYERIEKNRRRYLNNSNLFAENAVALYYSDAPEELLNDQLEKAGNLLGMAIDAGYSDARTIINLAYVKTAKGEVSVGNSIIRTLKVGASSFDWNLILDDFQTMKSAKDLFTKGFVLGIDDPMVWNKLGTFAYHFLKDNDLGKKFYEVALRFNPSSPIVLTNLARLITREPNNDLERIEEAWLHISKAASMSNHRFQWWRSVREEVLTAKQNLSGNPTEVQSLKKNFNLKKIKDIFNYFHSLKQHENPQERGIKFQELVNKYIDMSLGNSFKSHTNITDLKYQVDGAFFFDKTYYRVEAKWEKKPLDVNEVIIFKEKRLDTIGVSGLMISVNGFSDSAVKYAKKIKSEKMILFMDGDELELTMQGSPSLDETIRNKQLHFLLKDNPYYKIKSHEQPI